MRERDRSRISVKRIKQSGRRKTACAKGEDRQAEGRKERVRELKRDRILAEGEISRW